MNWRVRAFGVERQIPERQWQQMTIMDGVPLSEGTMIDRQKLKKKGEAYKKDGSTRIRGEVYSPRGPSYESSAGRSEPAAAGTQKRPYAAGDEKRGSCVIVSLMLHI